MFSLAQKKMTSWDQLSFAQKIKLIWPRRGATAYEVQIGKLYVYVCHLYGGHWRHWWQPSRWTFGWERD